MTLFCVMLSAIWLNAARDTNARAQHRASAPARARGTAQSFFASCLPAHGSRGIRANALAPARIWLVPNHCPKIPTGALAALDTRARNVRQMEQCLTLSNSKRITRLRIEQLACFLFAAPRVILVWTARNENALFPQSAWARNAHLLRARAKDVSTLQFLQFRFRDVRGARAPSSDWLKCSAGIWRI